MTKAVGLVMVLASEEAGGTAFAEPASLTPEWSLKLDAPLKRPHRSNRDYLPAPGCAAVGFHKNYSNACTARRHPQSILRQSPL